MRINRLYLLLCLVPTVLLSQTRMLRYPDIHADRIVFVYAGDLWTVSDQGGTATHLTSHPGLELSPKFSPDGSWIAFSGQYDGDDQVYVIPSTGGEPRQLTWYPSNLSGISAAAPISGSQVYGWIPDGQSVVFRSNREFWDERDGRLYKISTEGGLPMPLEMPKSGAGDISPDSEMIAYTPIYLEKHWWKDYRGGMAPDLYLLNRKNLDLQRITKYEGTDESPMWIGDTIYFVSDRTGVLNLFRYTPESSEIEQVTYETRHDVRWPSTDSQNRVVFELNGALRVIDVVTNNVEDVEIQVPSENLFKRTSQVHASRYIEHVGLSPRAKRVVMSARGDIFTVPSESGPLRNLTHSSDAHDRLATWSPDGRMIAFVSDHTGEEQIYQIAQDGSSHPEQLTTTFRTRLYLPKWSPDSEKIAFWDKDGRLYVLDVITKEVTNIYREEYYTSPTTLDHAWSPQGRYIAFSARTSFRNRSILIWDSSSGSVHQLGDDTFSEYSPTWGDNGEYLYYLSEREFRPFQSSSQWVFFTDRQTVIIAMALRSDAAHPFPPRSDEAVVDALSDSEGADSDSGLEAGDRGRDPEIEFDAIATRVTRVPVSPGNYSQLGFRKQRLIALSSPAHPHFGPPTEAPKLLVFDIEKRSSQTVSGITNWTGAINSDKILVQINDSYELRNLSDVVAEGQRVETDQLVMERNPSQEWKAIFHEAWRKFRDFFYAKNMHGINWESIRVKYESLLPHVAHRADLNYVIGEMASELSVSHIFVEAGDYYVPKRPEVPLLGAEFMPDSTAGYYRISRILDGQNEEPGYRSPLTEIGVDVREGDYLLAIDGTPIKLGDNPYRALRHKDMRSVRLLVNDEANTIGARDVLVHPIRNESNLRYLAWMQKNKKYVSEMTGNRVGYIHFADMAGDGLREFVKSFYPQMRKDGLIIDVRNNRGGFASQMILGQLNREFMGALYRDRSNDYMSWPTEGFFGHMVCLADEQSGSDGDHFPLHFKALGMGPVIGKRTWGGSVGLNQPPEPLLDGGVVGVPAAPIAGADGNWSVENRGTVPDIEVGNDSEAAMKGRDLQLERAVEEVLRAIEREPVQPVVRPADPVR